MNLIGLATFPRVQKLPEYEVISPNESYSNADSKLSPGASPQQHNVKGHQNCIIYMLYSK